MSNTSSDASSQAEPTLEVITTFTLIEASKRTVNMLWPINQRDSRIGICSKWSEAPTNFALGDPIISQLTHRLRNWLYWDPDETSEGDAISSHIIPNENKFIGKHKPTLLKTHINDLSRALASMKEGDIDTSQSILSELKWEPLSRWVTAHDKWQGSQMKIVPETIELQPLEEIGQLQPLPTAVKFQEPVTGLEAVLFA